MDVTASLMLYTPDVKVKIMTKKSSGNRAIFKPSKEWLEKKYWSEGLTLRDIGEILGISGTSVKRWFEVYEIPTRNYSQATKLSFERGRRERCPKCGRTLPKDGKHKCNALPSNVKAEICKLYLEGYSTAKIAKKFGISTAVIHKVLKRVGIITRNTRSVKLTVPKNREDLAYIAGILDGEGCIQVRLLKRKTQKWNNLKTEIIITNTCKELIEWLSRKLSLSIHEKQHKNPKWKTCYYVKIGNIYECLLFLKAVLPYLIAKRKQAEEAIKLISEYLSTPKGERIKKYG